MTGFRSVLLTAAVATCRILLMTRRGVLRSSPVALRKSNYQAWQILSAGFTIGRPALQENACENSGMFTSTPLIRYFAGECGSVMARTRRSSGRSLAQSRWANPMKKRCSE